MSAQVLLDEAQAARAYGEACYGKDATDVCGGFKLVDVIASYDNASQAYEAGVTSLKNLQDKLALKKIEVKAALAEQRTAQIQVDIMQNLVDDDLDLEQIEVDAKNTDGSGGDLDFDDTEFELADYSQSNNSNKTEEKIYALNEREQARIESIRKWYTKQRETAKAGVYTNQALG